MKVKSLSSVRLLATPWTAAYQAPPSMGFSRQEYWSGVPLPSPPRLSAYYVSGTVLLTPQQGLVARVAVWPMRKQRHGAGRCLPDDASSQHWVDLNPSGPTPESKSSPT